MAEDVVETVYIALIAAVPAVLSPLLMAWLTNRNRAQEKQEDYARQDVVSARAEEATRKVAETASLLVKSNEVVAQKAAEVAGITNSKLDVIHTLVNSNMSAAMQAELDSRRIAVTLMKEIIELKKVAGTEPTKETILELGAAQGKIQELEAAIADRLKQAKDVEKIQNDKMISNMKKEV